MAEPPAECPCRCHYGGAVSCPGCIDRHGGGREGCPHCSSSGAAEPARD